MPREDSNESSRSNYTITPRQAGSKWYLRAKRLEMAVGQYMDLDALKQRRIDHPELLKYRGHILGNIDGATEYASWTNFLVCYGPRKKCLSLGSGSGHIEKHLIGLGFTSSFDSIELSPHANARAQRNEQRIAPLTDDLNFVRLQPESFDFILLPRCYPPPDQPGTRIS